MAVKGRAQTFSSLLLGYFNNKGELIFAGHVGSGFDEESLSLIKGRLDTIHITAARLLKYRPLMRPLSGSNRNWSLRWESPSGLRRDVYALPFSSGCVRINLPVKSAGQSSVSVQDLPIQEEANGPDTILKQLQNRKEDFQIDVEGNKISFSNMGKILWPATTDHPGYTKRDLLTYLVRVSPIPPAST